MKQTLYDKLWEEHVVRRPEGSNLSLIYIDRHLIHEVTSPQAFDGMRLNARPLWRTESNLAVVDHNVATVDRHLGIKDKISRQQIEALENNTSTFKIKFIDLKNPFQGIVHVIGPELGATLPGMTVVCGDSHTSTHGALAALAFGIGTSEVEHVLATSCLLLKKMKNFSICLDSRVGSQVSAKDIILYIIGKIGIAGATGCTIEFRGEGIEALSVEERMTICNMSIEAGAKSSLVAFDSVTEDYVKNRPFSPGGEKLESALSYWRTLKSDPGAYFDRELHLDAKNISPQVTWGTNPEMVTSFDGRIPSENEMKTPEQLQAFKRALDYMGLIPGSPIKDISIDKVFIGSCTNSRIEDLRAAANILKGKVKSQVVSQALVVPGSGLVKRQAEDEGLHEVFLSAGFEWRDPGCSMCLGMNSDRLNEAERCASTSNRNFEGRQGRGGRTHLLSPQSAAASAIAGRLVDARSL
jgi:3-isopropylmalate/(R)-2-methylmalate dehydratase large subunit